MLQKYTLLEQQLISEAIRIRRRAYAPYSNFKVGAALLDINGNIHTGCNIESADYTLTSHAEMVAVDSMIKSGCLKIKIIIIVLACGENIPVPCGLCRQKIREFASTGDMKIIGINISAEEEIKSIFEFTLNELLPHSFGGEFLK